MPHTKKMTFAGATRKKRDISLLIVEPGHARHIDARCALSPAVSSISMLAASGVPQAARDAKAVIFLAVFQRRVEATIRDCLTPKSHAFLARAARAHSARLSAARASAFRQLPRQFQDARARLDKGRANSQASRTYSTPCAYLTSHDKPAIRCDDAAMLSRCRLAPPIIYSPAFHTILGYRRHFSWSMGFNTFADITPKQRRACPAQRI